MISEEIKRELLKVKEIEYLEQKKDFIRLIDFALKRDSLDVHTGGFGLHHFCVYNNMDELAKMILDSGVKYKYMSENVRDKLIVFHYFLEDDSIRKLIDGAIKTGNINYRGWNNTGILHLAAASKNIKLVKFLVENGIIINFYNYSQNTPLIVAVNHNCKDIVKILIENGADISLKDWNHRTPLEIAQSYNYDEIVNLLEKAKIDKDEDLYIEFKKSLKM